MSSAVGQAIPHRDPDLCRRPCSKCGESMCCLCDDGPFMCSRCQRAFDVEMGATVREVYEIDIE